MLRVTHLTCELRADPRGIDAPRPRLGWTLDSPERGQVQTAYRVWVAADKHMLAAEEESLWDSGKVTSPRSVHIPYGGAALASGQECWWKVRVWDRDGRPSDSRAAHWQMGLLQNADWRGRWISAPTPGDTQVDGLKLPPCPHLRKTFSVTSPPARATLFATARGVYEVTLNGARVGDGILAPGWTDYDKRIAYQTYDVTALLRDGENTLEAVLGDGWYCGYIGFDRARDYYGDRTQFLAQLNMEYAGGGHAEVVTDATWEAATGPILYSDMLMGESFDARLSPTGWRPVEALAAAAGTGAALVAQHDPPVRVTQELPAQSITEPAPGVFVFDLGQNMVGWARLTVTAPAGTALRLRFAEVLNPDGTLYTTNLRSARQTDTYLCRGGGVETWEPHFTFHGFRYVELTGHPGTPDLGTILGRVVHSDTPATGTFECSSPLVNQLQHNIVWGQRGNFLSVPTDCPQRDERLGWMGDAQVFVRTATCNRDVAAFFEKWVQDVSDAQSPEGGFPDVAPRLVDQADGAPAWGDAGIIVPWIIYQVYGDTEILRRHYGAMAGWMRYLADANPDGLWTRRRNNDFGDWLSIDAETPKDVLATAYFAHDAALLARIAQVLGRDEDAAHYQRLCAHIQDAFCRAYVTDDGRVHGDTQTGYLLALRFGLLPERLRPPAARHLVDDIAAKGGHLSTGFVGVSHLCPVLTETGHNDVAYRLLLSETFPSWGYSIRQGATTIWERWDGWTEERGFQDPGMNSFNHYSLGSVGEWLYRHVAGIDTDPDRPGFAHIRIAPHPGPGLTHARAEYHSVRGRIVSGWRREGDTLTLDVTIPANTTATVALPTTDAAAVTEGGLPIGEAPGVQVQGIQGDRLLCEIGSGSYRFQTKEASHSG